MVILLYGMGKRAVRFFQVTGYAMKLPTYKISNRLGNFIRHVNTVFTMLATKLTIHIVVICNLQYCFCSLKLLSIAKNCSDKSKLFIVQNSYNCIPLYIYIPLIPLITLIILIPFIPLIPLHNILRPACAYALYTAQCH